ncbi:MAG: DUF2110 family protein [Halobacteriota archaeon]
MEVRTSTYVYVAGDARERALRSADGLLGDRLSELDVERDTRLDGERLVVEVEGEDADVAASIVENEFGAPVSGEPGVYVGGLVEWDERGWVVDREHRARVPASELESLGEGKPSQIRERYGVVQHTPLEIEVTGDGVGLTDRQVDALWSWRKGSGRLNVNSTTRSEIRATVNRAGHAHDVVTVERLGLLEQSVVCREATDPPGLLASVGPYVNGEMLCVVT